MGGSLTMRNLRNCPTQITTVFRGNMKVNHGKPSNFGDNIKQTRFCQHVQDLEVICSIYRSLYSNFGKWSLKDRWMLGKDRSHLKQAVKWKMTWGQVLFLTYSWKFHKWILGHSRLHIQQMDKKTNCPDISTHILRCLNPIRYLSRLNGTVSTKVINGSKGLEKSILTHRSLRSGKSQLESGGGRSFYWMVTIMGTIYSWSIGTIYSWCWSDNINMCWYINGNYIRMYIYI